LDQLREKTLQRAEQIAGEKLDEREVVHGPPSYVCAAPCDARAAAVGSIADLSLSPLSCAALIGGGFF